MGFPVPPATHYKQVALFLTAKQHEGLKRLSAETFVPMQVYMRYAIQRLLADHHILPREYNEVLENRVAGLKKGARK